MTTIITAEQSVSSVTPNHNKLEKSPTGINGFDEITYGGLPKNRPTVLVGASGTGKTFMSMEYIIKGIMQYNEPGVFMTFEEKSEELLTNVASLNYDLIKLLDENKLFIEHLNFNTNEIQEIGKYNIEGLFQILEQAIQKVNAKRIVLDSFDTLFSNFDTRVLRSEFKKLFFWLKEKKVTAIITAELGDTFLTRLGLEENVADCVIELNNRIVNQIGTRRIRIIKYRGSFNANNEYPFIIDNFGMTIFPNINQRLDTIAVKEYISSGIPSLDEMLENKGFYLGSSILVSGTAGTGKTSITASFANDVCIKKKKCFFCAFEETPNQIIRNMQSVGIDLSTNMKSNLLEFYYARPTLQNLELHFMAIKERIENSKPDVIILDPVTNLMTEGPNSDVRSMLTRFIDYLKTKQITVMFTAAITIGSIAQNPSDEGISSMVDTWLMLQDIDLNQQRATNFYIMKSRGMSHSKEEKRLIISKKGVALIPITSNFKRLYQPKRKNQLSHDNI
jgi:circadian clock protein KaiC